jgi:hypothetical protein
MAARANPSITNQSRADAELALVERRETSSHSFASMTSRHRALTEATQRHCSKRVGAQPHVDTVPIEVRVA